MQLFLRLETIETMAGDVIDSRVSMKCVKINNYNILSGSFIIFTNVFVDNLLPFRCYETFLKVREMKI